jgi:hypothetical protein
MDRLDEEKLETLWTWGEGLLDDGRAELRAAGSAILMLVEEIELVNVDLWHARPVRAREAGGLSAKSEEPASQDGSDVQSRSGASVTWCS